MQLISLSAAVRIHGFVGFFRLRRFRGPEESVSDFTSTEKLSSLLLVFRLFILCVFFVSLFCLSHTSLVTWTASHSSTRMCLWSANVVVEQVQSVQADNNSTTQMIESVPTDELTIFFAIEEGYIISSLEPQLLLSVVMGVLKMYDPYKWDTGWSAKEKERETWLFFCFVDLPLFLKTHLVW